MSLKKVHATDRAKEASGVRIEIGMNEYNEKPMAIIVARMSRNNQKYQQAFSDKFDPHMSAIQSDAMDEMLARKLVRELFTDEILKGIENIPLSDLTDDAKDNTTDLPFERDKILALFEKYPDAYDDWEARAKKASNFRAAAKDKAAKN